MENKEKNTNVFRIVLTLNSEVIMERIFSGDVFNPLPRYTVDIRKNLPKIISILQKTISHRSQNYIFSVGNSYEINLLKSYEKQVSFIKKKDTYFKSKIDFSETPKSDIFKFGLYLNQNTVVEREFHVMGYNPSSRFSMNLYHAFYDIYNIIYKNILENDKRHMWDDIDIIKYYGIFYSQIKELDLNNRQELLKNKHNPSYIKKVKANFNII